jgi:hypothetical protein
LQEAVIYRIIKAGLANMNEMQTIISFNDLQKMNDYLAMESTIESEISKDLIPKVQ